MHVGGEDQCDSSDRAELTAALIEAGKPSRLAHLRRSVSLNGGGASSNRDSASTFPPATAGYSYLLAGKRFGCISARHRPWSRFPTPALSSSATPRAAVASYESASSTHETRCPKRTSVAIDVLLGGCHSHGCRRLLDAARTQVKRRMRDRRAEALRHLTLDVIGVGDGRRRVGPTFTSTPASPRTGCIEHNARSNGRGAARRRSHLPKCTAGEAQVLDRTAQQQ